MPIDCRCCGRMFPTERGLTEHISRVDACRTLFHQRLKRKHEEMSNQRQDFTDNVTPAPEIEGDAVEDPVPKRRQPTVEDVEDEDTRKSYYAEKFRGAGKTYGKAPTQFERYKAKQDELGLPPWAPYKDEEEWELAHWLLKNRVTQKAIEAYLRLKIVSDVVFLIDTGLHGIG
jgi:hypothetical protein